MQRTCDEEMATRLSMTIWRIFFCRLFSVSGLNRMVRNGKQLRRFNVGSGHETFGHGVYSRGFDASNSSPAVSLVRLNNPQLFIFLHAYAAFARHWKFEKVENENKNKSTYIGNPNWHEGWYFYLLVIFWSDFVSWFFIKTFQTFWRWKLTSIRLFCHTAQHIESFKSFP